VDDGTLVLPRQLWKVSLKSDILWQLIMVDIPVYNIRITHKSISLYGGKQWELVACPFCVKIIFIRLVDGGSNFQYVQELVRRGDAGADCFPGSYIQPGWLDTFFGYELAVN
jgi:hypothetical protein